MLTAATAVVVCGFSSVVTLDRQRWWDIVLQQVVATQVKDSKVLALTRNLSSMGRLNWL